MASAGGKEVGRVSIRVVPDTDGFRKKTEAGLRKEKLRSVKVKVEPEVDDAKLQREMKRAAEMADQKAEIELDADDKKLQNKLRKVRDLVAKSPNIDFGIEREIAKFRKELDDAFDIQAELDTSSLDNQLQRIIRDSRHKLKFDVDEDNLRGRLGRAIKGARMRISTELDDRGLRAKAEAAASKLRDVKFKMAARVELAKAEAVQARMKAEALFREIEARISVKAGPFIAKCRAAAKAASAGLKVTAKLDIDRRHIAGVLSGIGQAANFLQRPIYKVFGAQVFEDAIRNFTRIKGILASITLGASALLVPVAALGSSLGSAAVAAGKLMVGMAPAAIGAIALGVAGMAKSFAGFGDVLKSTNLDELNEAMKGMGPATREGARGVYEMKNAFNEASAAAQEGFWSKITNDMSILASTAGAAGMLVTKLSQSAGVAANKLLEFASSAPGVQMISLLLSSAYQSASNLADAFFGVVPGIMAIGAAAGPVFAQLTEGMSQSLSDWSDRMVADFESGALQQQIQEMVNKVQEAKAVFSDLGAIISGVWNAAAAAGEKLLGPMRESIAATREWVESAEGVKSLNDYFGSMAEVVSVLSPIFGEIAQTIVGTVVPAMANFIKAAGPGMQQFTQGFAELVNQLAPFASVIGAVFGAIVGKIGELLPKLAPLVPVIIAVAVAFQGWALLGGVIAPVIGVLGSFMGVLGTVLGVVTSVIGGVFSTLGSMFGRLGGLLGGLSGPLSAIGGLFSSMTFPIIAVIAVIAAVVAAFATVDGAFEGLKAAAEPMLSSFQQIGQALVQFGQSIWTSLQPAFQAIVPVVTNFVGLISDIVGALTPVIIVIFQVAAAIVGALVPVFVALMPAVNAVIGILRGLVQALAPILAYVVMVAGAFLQMAASIIGAVASALAGVISFVVGVIAGFVNMVSAVIGIVGGWVAQIAAFFFNLISTCVSAATSLWSSVTNAFSSGVSRAVSFVSQMPGRCRAALGNVGSVLLSSGKALIQGFINGIKSMMGAVADAARAVVDKVRGFFPFSPAKEGPFSGKGYTTYSGKALMTDFGKGMLSAKGGVVGAVGQVMDAAQNRIAQANKDKILQPVLESNAKKIADARKKEREAEDKHVKKLAEIRKSGKDVDKQTAEENKKHAEEIAKIRKDMNDSLEAPDYSKMNLSFKEYWVGGVKEVLKQDLDRAVKQADLAGQMRRTSLDAVRQARAVFGNHPILARVEANVNSKHFDWAVQKAIDESEIHEVPVNFVVENLKEVKDFFGMGDGVISRAIDAAMEWDPNNTDARGYREASKNEVHYHVEDMNEAIRLEKLRERKQMMRMV